LIEQQGDAAKNQINLFKAEYDGYISGLDIWLKEIKEDADFYWGKQWREEDAAILKARGHAPLVINRIFPTLEQKKAILSNLEPGFTFMARGTGNQAAAAAMADVARYIWDANNTSEQMLDVVHNRIVYGVGYLLPTYDRFADEGKGEVRLKSVHPLDVIYDPNIRGVDFYDAASYYIRGLVTKEALISLMPDRAAQIAKLPSSQASNIVNMPQIRWNQENQEVYGDKLAQDLQEKVEIYERHAPVRIKHYSIIFPDGTSRVLSEPQLQQEMQFNQEFNQMITMGQVEARPFYRSFTRVTVIANWTHIVLDDVFPISYPIITPFANYNPQNGRFIGDVRIVKSVQEEINKRRSLIIAHLTTSTNMKWLIEEGSIDESKWQEDMAKPSVVLKYKYGATKPERAEPTAIPNGLFQEEAESKYDLEYTLGIYDYMMGSGRGAHDTARGVAMMDEIGNRRLKHSFQGIARGMERLGRRIMEFMIEYYRTPKIIAITPEIGQPRETGLNVSGGLLFKDMNINDYMVVVSPNSLMPTNRHAKVAMLKDLADQGYVRRKLVTENLDIPNAQEEAQVMDDMQQLSQQMQMLQEDNKELNGQVEQMEGEIRRLQRQVELEKFKADLEDEVNKIKVAKEVTVNDLKAIAKDAQAKANEMNNERKAKAKQKPNEGES
jgi:hypothetical protein